MDYFDVNNIGTHIFFGSDEAIIAANSRANFIAKCFPEIHANDVASTASWSNNHVDALKQAASQATPRKSADQRKLARKLGLNVKSLPAVDTDGKGGLVAPLKDAVVAALIALHIQEAAKLD
jgi:hypothetical protein